MATELAAQAQVTPMDLIQQALAAGQVEQMTQLYDLQQRWETDQARKAYNSAFAAFKADAVSIVKNITVSDGPLKGKRYADLFGVVSAITPALARHGLSHSWKQTRDDKDWIEVTCTLRHELGHSETNSMGAAPDTGPGRNAIQARGSAKSYLERYTLLGVTGMAASGVDDDGRATEPQLKQVPHEEFDRHMALIEAAPSVAELQRLFRTAYGLAKGIGDEASMQLFLKAKDRRKAEVA